MNYRLLRVFSTLLLSALLVSACGQPAEAVVTQMPAATEVPTEVPAAPATPAEPAAPTAPVLPANTEGELPEVDPSALSGNIIMAGSSTVFPLAEAVAEQFKADGFAEDKGSITVDSIGSGGGFERFCKTGESDIANASRPIKDSERENCIAIGRTPIEFRVGTDALAVVISSENDFVNSVTLAELAMIFSKDVTKWNEVRPEWPAEDILRFSPGTDSGTFDYFIEAVMDKTFVKDATADKGKGEEALLSAANVQFSEDDNVLVKGVEGSPYAIGYFGFAYYTENQGLLKALAIEDVEPNEDNVNAGKYPLARPLFIYSDAKIMAEKPQVAAFINYFLTYVNDLIGDVGYFPAPADAIDGAIQAWLDATNP